MSSWDLLLTEARLQTKIFFRTAVAAFFTLVMPVMFLVMISFFLGNEPGATQYVTPALAVFGMVTATFTNLAINTSMARDEGILKRVTGTPLPMTLHLAGRIISAVFVGLISVALMLLVGWALFDVVIPWPRMGVFALLLMLGAATFSALGLAVAAITPTSRAAPAIANFVVLPLAFISGVFFPLEGAPSWIRTVASLLPLEPMASAAIETFSQEADPGFPARAVVSLLIWGLVGLVVAVRFFNFEPAGGRAGRGRSQSSTEIET